PCPGLVELIETVPMPTGAIRELLEPVVNDLRTKNADVIVLGCTHYPFVAPVISSLAGPGVSVIETGQPVARQLNARLQAEGLLNPQLESQDEIDRVSFFTTGNPQEFRLKLCSLLGDQWATAQVQQLEA
ncbi:MAG TPA: aspartate/glutamate racemase family protein, partial [Limnobacter sp.]|nr:aspartate/glutamate racemase family protein [Limnobacter sp.]